MILRDPTHQAIVIGSGVAGMAAAAELAALGLATALVDDGNMGGLMMNVGEIADQAAYAGQSGADLVNQLLERALEAGADYQMGTVTALGRAGALWRLPDLEIAAPSVILATGAKLKRLGVPGEDALMGRGVSQCAFCDGGLYRGRDVHVVGGGDAAYQEALHLADLCASVTMLQRGETPRARQAFLDAAASRANLKVRHGVKVMAALGQSGLDGIRLQDAASGAETEAATSALFVFIGLTPETALAPSEARRDAAAALIVDGTMQTTTAGLYAIGAARSGYGGQISDALADARRAAAGVSGRAAI